MKPRIGAHMSITGGLDQALVRGRQLDCETIQLFTKNANQWKERTLTQDEIDRFLILRRETGMTPIVSHGGYLINLATPDPTLSVRSLKAVYHELQRCHSLGVDYLVIHPGAHRGAGKRKGIRHIVKAIESLRSLNFDTSILLETTAGQGTYIGSRLEEIAEIMNGIGDSHIGFCLDTCHVFAAGYPLGSEEDCMRLFDQIDKILDLHRLKVIHLNDSLQPLGSKRDRHAHIGQGMIGGAAFRWIMRNPFLNEIPKIIETPKENDMDKVNLDLLRRFASS